MQGELPTVEQWKRIKELALRAAMKIDTTHTLADWLVELGVIHDTPHAKKEWAGW